MKLLARQWVIEQLESFLQCTSVAIGRTDLVVGPVTPAIAPELQETYAFLEVGVISKPVVIHNAIWLQPAG
jgi:hypothetical protein